MANRKISSLSALGGIPAVGDIIPITDVSDTTGSSNGTTKKVTVANLVAAAPQGDLLASNNLSDVANAGTSRTNLGLGTAATTASTAYATSAQGATADTAIQPGDLGTAALLDVGTTASKIVQLDGSARLPAVNGSQLTNLPASAVDGTAVTSTGETGATKFLREDGDGTCSFQTVSVEVTASDLRGTDNPHIGAFPNQSFLVTDNPDKSVMVIADASGNLDFLVNSDSSRVYLNTPSSRLELTTGVSVVEDSTEPDIEITTTSGTYSLITGDSDALGANGLPARQGFNVPDIGANQAPLLISGGTIS